MVIQGQLKEHDYVAAQFVHMRPRPIFAFIGILLLGLAIWAMLNGALLILSIVIIYLAFSYLFLIPFKAKKVFKQYKALSDPVKVSIEDNGLYFKRDNGEGLVTWPEIIKWRHNKKIILLYPASNVFYLLASHLFESEESFAKFKSILEEKCGKAF